MKLTIELSKPAQGFYSTGTNKISKVSTLDGYSIAERMLECVIFKAELISDKILVVTLNDPSDEDYMSDLNAKKWFHYVGESFIESGGRNNDTRCFGLNIDGYENFLLGFDASPSPKLYRFDSDITLLKESGFRSYDGVSLSEIWIE
jgi:hypothetical protein